MILVGLGANLPSPVGEPLVTVEAALKRLESYGIRVVRRSRWYRTSPVPASDQPDFVNGVAVVETPLGPQQLLTLLLQVEAEYGRVRGQRWDARPLDLDLLAYGDQVLKSGIEVPHPRLHQRRFVLVPLAEVAPDWVHPTLKRPVSALLADLTDADRVELLT